MTVTLMRIIEYIILGLFALFFLKDLLLMPVAMGLAENWKGYVKTISIAVIFLVLIFSYAYVMGELFPDS